MEKIQPEELKTILENDLYFLAKDILGYEQLEDETHVEVCQFLEKLTPRKALLLPRGTFKTTIGTIARPIQKILQNPNIRILIFSETYKQSKKFLSEIKQQLQSNEKLIALYGQFQMDPGWREEGIVVRQRTRVSKEDTIMTGGVDVVNVGFHYDLIVIDDPHSQNNISTKDQIDKVKNTYKLLLPMLEPGGEICFIGTRWHFYDLASMLIEGGDYDLMLRAAETIRTDGTIKLFFPQRLSKEYLTQQKKELGSYIYNCQYQNNPIDDEDADFKRAWFKYYKEEELHRKLLHTFITIDPGGKEEDNDFTGVIINSVDQEKNWYLRKTMKLRISAPELIKKMFEWNMIWHPIKFGIEKEKYSLTIKPFLDEAMFERNEFLPIELLSPKVSNKEMRIRGLSPRYEAGRIYHNQDDPDVIDLEDELLRFPKAKNDDLSDSESMQLDIAKTPQAEATPDYTQKKIIVKKFYPDLGH
jgi:hypothetical protein